MVIIYRVTTYILLCSVCLQGHTTSNPPPVAIELVLRGCGQYVQYIIHFSKLGGHSELCTYIWTSIQTLTLSTYYIIHVQ